MPYVVDNLIKCECWECEQQFIVSEYSFKRVKKIRCPYCGSKIIDHIVYADKDSNIDLGCLAIHHYEREIEQDENN